jgi:hypothetical protein
MQGLCAVRLAITGLIMVAGAAPAFAGAPPQLYNKSIHIAWSESVMQRDETGKTTTPRIDTSRIVYVSSAGRLFIRGSRGVKNRNFEGHVKGETGPGEGRAGVLAFEGNQLIGTAEFEGAARRVTVSFDPGFSSCTVSVVYGKSGAVHRWKAMDGRMHEVLAINIGATSCSISDGNALAN